MIVPGDLVVTRLPIYVLYGHAEYWAGTSVPVYSRSVESCLARGTTMLVVATLGREAVLVLGGGAFGWKPYASFRTAYGAKGDPAKVTIERG